MASKRSSSPLDQWQKDKRTCKDTDYMERLVDRAVATQMKRIEQHVFNEHDCRELRAKHEKVDKNCLSWHDFAVDLQQRVKRLAVILNRQQETIKTLKLKNGVATADASVQTDEIPSLLPLDKKPVIKSEHVIKKEIKSESCKPSQAKSSHPAAFIDLTGNDDDGDQSEVQSLNDVREAAHSKLSTVHCGKAPTNGRDKVESKYGVTSSATSSIGQGVLATEASTSQKSHLVFTQVNKSSLGQRNLSMVPSYPPLPPSPLPPKILPKGALLPPFQPDLKIRKSTEGLELSWDYNHVIKHAKMEFYELYVYQRNPNSVTHSNRWKKIKSEPIKAMPLPMACTLSQYSTLSTYYFAVRGKDVYGRFGKFSIPCSSDSLDG